MKALVFGGSGKVGSAVAWDLSKDDSIDTIGITGRNLDTLERTKKWIGSSKVVAHVIDVNDKAALTALMRQYDSGALALRSASDRSQV